MTRFKSAFKPLTLILLLMLVLVLPSCFRQNYLEDYKDLPVVGGGSKTLSTANVKDAILTACQNKGWLAREVSPGLISASLSIRHHYAEIDIPYSASNYSIIYKNSTNLKYNPDKRTIHNQYNNWIIYLRQQISLNLASYR